MLKDTWGRERVCVCNYAESGFHFCTIHRSRGWRLVELMYFVYSVSSYIYDFSCLIMMEMTTTSKIRLSWNVDIPNVKVGCGFRIRIVRSIIVVFNFFLKNHSKSSYF